MARCPSAQVRAASAAAAVRSAFSPVLALPGVLTSSLMHGPAIEKLGAQCEELRAEVKRLRQTFSERLDRMSLGRRASCNEGRRPNDKGVPQGLTYDEFYASPLFKDAFADMYRENKDVTQEWADSHQAVYAPWDACCECQ